MLTTPKHCVPLALLASSIMLAGCSSLSTSKLFEEPSSADRIAEHLDINMELKANRGQGQCQMEGISWADGAEHSSGGPCYETTMTLTSPEILDDKDWAIYFSQPEPVIGVSEGEFKVEHINGDLHRLTPTEAFTGFESGQPKQVNLVFNGLALSEAKFMPNYYVVSESAPEKPRTIDSTRLQTDPETGLEIRPYLTPFDNPVEQYKNTDADQTPFADSEYLYEKYSALESVDGAEESRIIPRPAATKVLSGTTSLTQGISLNIQGTEPEQLTAALEHLQKLGVNEKSGGLPVDIMVKADKKATPGSYNLKVMPEGIYIQASDDEGAFYGLQSLASLIQADSLDIQNIEVSDAPRYPFRGMHLDVARNFRSTEMVKDLIRQMAAYKLNVVQLHLADDEGWRLEIDGLPELTDVGGHRGHDPEENESLLAQLGGGLEGQNDGYFSKEDYIDILKTAQAHKIQVIPSFDMPGHSRAAIKSMEARYRKFMEKGDQEAAEQYLLSDIKDKSKYSSIQFYSDNTINVCMDSSYAFTDKVISELAQLHEAAGQPLTRYHIGADETPGAWKDSPACEEFLADNPYGIEKIEELGAHFIQRTSNLLADKSIEAAGWNDGMGKTSPEKMPEKVQSNFWGVFQWGGVAEANRQANLGWEVVLSMPDSLYFDFPYEPDPKEGGYYWGSRYTSLQKVFNLMPGNLPAMAEVYKTTIEHDLVIDDATPLKQGVQWAGIQGQLWSETIRSDDAAEFMIFPRMLALAERAWTTPDWEPEYNYQGQKYSSETDVFTEQMEKARNEDYNAFITALGKRELSKLDKVGISYRVPTAGAKIENGQLTVKPAYPGLTVEYREKGGEWKTYESAVAVDGSVEVRTLSADQSRASRAIPVI